MLKTSKAAFIAFCLIAGAGCTVSTSGSVNTTVGSASPAASASSAPAASASAAATPAANESAAPSDMKVDDFKFTESKDGPEIYTTTFKAGGDIFFTCEVKGFTIAKDGEAWVQGDLQLLGADDKVITSKENIFDVHDKVPEGQTATLTAKQNLEVGKDTPPGDYKLEVVFRDKMSGGKTVSSNKISVEAP